MALPRGVRAFAHRDYRLFWGGQLVSLVGTWMQSVGQAWLVLELTNSPFRLGMICTLQFAPILLFSFAGGAVSDRVYKRRVLVATQSTLMLQAFTLAALAWTGEVQYWHVAVLATLYGCVNTLDIPTRQSFVVELTGKNDLISAIALNAMLFNAARVAGPAAAGLLVARYGPAGAFFVNGVSFLAVIGALLAMRADGAPPARARASFRADVLQSMAYATGTPRVKLVLALLLSVSLFVLNFNILVPLIARNVLGQGAHGFGLLMTALGAGAVSGALTLAAVGLQRPSLGLLVAAAVALSIGSIGLSLVHTFAAAAAVLVGIGFAQIVFTSGCNTMLQITVPDELRGRVMGLYTLVFAGVTPIGAFVSGWLAEHVGVLETCALGGGAGLIAVVTLAALWRTRVARVRLRGACGCAGRASRGGRRRAC